jgi:N-acetyl-gamma-glutamyl-phosphate reductase
MINVSIVGAAGYSGEELLRILIQHPEVEIKNITSRKNNGMHISEVFPRFADTDLYFSMPNVNTIIEDSEVVFLALPHGLAAEYAEPFVKAGLKVFDLSADFRLHSLNKYKTYYGVDHPAPELLKIAVYGAPERHREKIISSQLVACPGCYPTSITLPLAPLLQQKLISHKDIIVFSMSGVSGAGRKVDLPFIFPECNESVRPYAITGHRHLPEIEQELAEAATENEIHINFIPHLVPITRGIHSTIVTQLKPGVTTEHIHKALQNTYRSAPFVRILPMGKLADTKHVTLTNVCEIGFAYDSHTGKLILSSAIDNLTKGASGQAVQAMNIAYNFKETTGLL